jgi:formylglycine-generating enzyme required for sulfatase activity
LRTSRFNPWLLVAVLAALLLVPLAVFLSRRGGPEVVELPRANNSLDMEFVEVPAGVFTMGSPEGESGGQRGDDEGAHEVEITRPYWLGAHEVTREQFARVMGFNPSWSGSDKRRGRSDLPAEDVSWEEAAEFCRRLSERPEEKEAGRSYRLPTEAEWEYACRAGTQTAFAAGDELSAGHANCNVGQLHPGPRPVGAGRPNRWALHDLHGNAAEWVQDWYDRDYYRYSPRQDPQGPARGDKKAVRGGSWSDPPASCRCANRTGLPPDVRLGNGFRVVLVRGAEPKAGPTARK